MRSAIAVRANPPTKQPGDTFHPTMMSALGQKQTYALQQAMSALPPKADMCSAFIYVRFGPKAEYRIGRHQRGRPGF